MGFFLLPDPEHLEYHYFEELSTWDIFAASSCVTLGTLGILLNLWALVVVARNKNLSGLIKSYLLADHLFRIISGTILFYPAVCPFIRIAGVASFFYEDGWEDTPEFLAAKRKHTSVCVVLPWNSIWGAEANQVFALCFTMIMHFLEFLQFGISINRWLAISFGGRYHQVFAKIKHLQVDLMFTVTWVAFYKCSFSNSLYFDDFSYSSVSSEYEGYIKDGQLMKIIRIMSVVITFFAILLDWSTFVLLKRHLEQSRKLTQSDEKTGAEIRLAKQLLINHFYAIFVATTSCYMLVRFSPIDGIRDYTPEAYAMNLSNLVLIKTSWFIFMATTFLPATANVVNGVMTMIFLSPPKQKASPATSKSTLTKGKERSAKD